jgi:molybdopterin converting factor subunit 1
MRSNDEYPREIIVKLFAISKDIIGKREITLMLPNEITLGMLRSRILEIYPSLVSLNNQFVLAVNHKIVTEDTMINHSDEIALLPPVSGG